MWLRTWHHYLMTLIAIVAVQGRLIADEWLTGDELDEVRYVLHSVQASREGLVRGVVRFHGQYSSTDVPGRPDISSESVEMLCAFDFERGFYRFDVRDVTYGYEVKPNSDLSKDHDKSNPDFIRKVLHSSRTDESFAWCEVVSRNGTNHKSALAIQPPNEEWSGGMLAEYHVIDVRSIGLMSFFEFTGSPHMTRLHVGTEEVPHDELPAYIDNLYKYVGQRMLAPVSELGGYFRQLPVKGTTRDGNLLTIHFSLSELTIDLSAGNSPVEFRHVGRVDLEGFAKTKWMANGDVWVPESFSVENETEFTGRQRYEFDAEWIIVNNTVPDEWFDFRKFPDIAPGTRVVDSRDGKPRRIGNFDRNGYVPVSLPPQLEQTKSPEVTDPPWRFRLLVIANMVMLAAVIGWQIYRTRSKR